MKNLFRSRLPSQLTLSQITKLSNQSNLSFEEIEECYDRFILCYPYGYVSFEEFLIYLKRLSIYNENQQHQLSKSIIKQLFYNLNRNKDKQLNFEEFFSFNLLINYGSNEDKIKLILKLHNPQKIIYYTRQQIGNILIDMFALLNCPRLTNDFSRNIDEILNHINMNIDRNSNICWNTFCTSVLNHSSLLELLLTNIFDNEKCEGKLITRF